MPAQPGTIDTQSLQIPYFAYGPTCGSSQSDAPATSIGDRIASRARSLLGFLGFPGKQDRRTTPETRRVDAVWYQSDVPTSKIKARQASSPHLIIPPTSPSTLLKPDDASDSDDDADRLADHLQAIHAELWALNPDPWVGRWLFIVPGLAKMPWYVRLVVSVAANGGTIADVGCGVGGDLRRLAEDASAAANGGPSPRLIGLDSRPQHFDVGDRLFGPPPLCVEFESADILDWNRYRPHLPPAARNLIEELKSRADVVVLNMLLSDFCWEDQLREVLASAANLVKPGGRVVGYTLAVPDGKAGVFRAPWERNSRFLHDTWSFRAICFDLRLLPGLSSDSSWDLEEVELFDLKDIGWEGDDSAWLSDSSLHWSLHDRPRVEHLKGLAFSKSTTTIIAQDFHLCPSPNGLITGFPIKILKAPAPHGKADLDTGGGVGDLPPVGLVRRASNQGLKVGMELV
ncbi:hypothetical protein MGG_05841 [Pyricularia oryzae 70-15]|uniref:Uncharacterized protein n=3 Tax=Pyricularia oryzae TaxID=318829 RepID=G4N3N2_PYRO7|nr:uncharacterized protein MGG_05841 [Pyricularia oryzae 70-15]EHA51856.1 hypothetical protein MGG_05841 [Pyricularia oryzae 70-15]ELQ41414.1 hypothetical protein OOU_Y34scaffold00282g1 [Pyricularia oryzae Y34]